MGIVETYNYYIYEKADPRTQAWPLTSTPVSVLWITIAYILFVKVIGPAWMREREPFDLKKILKAYNVFQIFSCCYLIYGVLKYACSSESCPIFGCCPADYSDNYNAIELAKIIWWTFMLKITELIETVFFVLRKKDNQVSKLHLYHHISTMNFSWAGAHYIPGGMASFLIVINSFVHVLMYTYYLASTFGPKWQKILKPWKPKLTMIQMIQFCFIIIHLCLGFRSSCPIPKVGFCLFIPNILLVFYMFYEFYQKTYNKKQTKKL